MSVKIIEELGELVCEAIEFAREKMGFSSLDKADKICQAILPDLKSLSGSDSLSDSEDAGKLASAAYDMALKVKKALSP